MAASLFPPGGRAAGAAGLSKCCEMLRFALHFFLSTSQRCLLNQSLLVTCVDKTGSQILEAINDELTKRGHNAWPEKASGYFYFMGGEATE